MAISVAPAALRSSRNSRTAWNNRGVLVRGNWSQGMLLSRRSKSAATPSPVAALVMKYSSNPYGPASG